MKISSIFGAFLENTNFNRFEFRLLKPSNRNNSNVYTLLRWIQSVICLLKVAKSRKVFSNRSHIQNNQKLDDSNCNFVRCLKIGSEKNTFWDLATCRRKKSWQSWLMHLLKHEIEQAAYNLKILDIFCIFRQFSWLFKK